MSIATGVLKTPTTQTTLGLVAGIPIAAYTLTQRPTIAGQIGAAYEIAAGLFSLTPLGPLLATEGAVVSTVGKLYEGHLERRRAHRLRQRLRSTFADRVALGHHEAYAARAAAARVGVNPETVFPLGHTQHQVVSLPWAPKGVPTSFAVPVYDEAAAHPFYDPETRAVGGESGTLIKYGAGPQADQARAAWYSAMVAELASRPSPATGLVPGLFARTSAQG